MIINKWQRARVHRFISLPKRRMCWLFAAFRFIEMMFARTKCPIIIIKSEIIGHAIYSKCEFHEFFGALSVTTMLLAILFILMNSELEFWPTYKWSSSLLAVATQNDSMRTSCNRRSVYGCQMTVRRWIFICYELRCSLPNKWVCKRANGPLAARV